jgi:hypothetical protein
MKRCLFFMILVCLNNVQLASRGEQRLGRSVEVARVLCDSRVPAPRPAPVMPGAKSSEQLLIQRINQASTVPELIQILLNQNQISNDSTRALDAKAKEILRTMQRGDGNYMYVASPAQDWIWDILTQRLGQPWVAEAQRDLQNKFPNLVFSPVIQIPKMQPRPAPIPRQAMLQVIGSPLNAECPICTETKRLSVFCTECQINKMCLMCGLTIARQDEPKCPFCRANLDKDASLTNLVQSPVVRRSATEKIQDAWDELLDDLANDADTAQNIFEQEYAGALNGLNDLRRMYNPEQCTDLDRAVPLNHVAIQLFMQAIRDLKFQGKFENINKIPGMRHVLYGLYKKLKPMRAQHAREQMWHRVMAGLESGPENVQTIYDKIYRQAEHMYQQNVDIFNRRAADKFDNDPAFNSFCRDVVHIQRSLGSQSQLSTQLGKFLIFYDLLNELREGMRTNPAQGYRRYFGLQ